MAGRRSSFAVVGDGPVTPQWVPVGGYPHYEVDIRTGRCRSIDRIVLTGTGPRRFSSVELRQSGPGSTVTLYAEGRPHSFTPAGLLDLAVIE